MSRHPRAAVFLASVTAAVGVGVGVFVGAQGGKTTTTTAVSRLAATPLLGNPASFGHFKAFVTDSQAASLYTTWAKANCGASTGGTPTVPAPTSELARWFVFRDAILAGSIPAAPTMATAYGRSLIDAGAEYLDTIVVPPPPPTTTTAPTTTAPTTTAPTTTAPTTTVWPPPGYKPPPTPVGTATVLWRGQLLAPSAKPPLVIMLSHSHPPEAEKKTRWMEAADRYGLAVAIPDYQGVNGTWYPFDQSLTWLKAQLPVWLSKLNADPAQVYIAGFSAGSWEAEYAAFEGSMRLAGIAPVSGWADPAWPRNRKTPIRFLSMMGDQDAYPWQGTPGKRDGGLVTASEFAVLNGHPAAVPTPTRAGAVDHYVWDALDTEFLLIHGGKHFWPGDPAAAGTPDATFSATDLVANWVLAHP